MSIGIVNKTNAICNESSDDIKLMLILRLGAMELEKLKCRY